MKPAKDDYPTCAETYATLRLYHREQSAGHVTAALNIEPCETQKIGDTYEARSVIRTKKLNGWFLCTKKSVASFDAEKHLSYLLDRLENKANELRSLIEQGWRADIACMWDSEYGHGGPALSPELMTRLARLGIELWFDIYFYGAYKLTEVEKNAFGEK
jgi:hypothetical protein